MVLGPQWYENAIGILENEIGSASQIKHCFQTNATLISKDWIDFIKQRNISIGVSLDGPQFLNDRHRTDRSGKGVFNRIMTGVKDLQQANIPFHVISVLTEEALSYPDEIHEFFTSHEIFEVGFNIEEIECDNQESSLNRSDTPQRIEQFFTRMMVLNDRSSHPLNIREVEGMTGAILQKIPSHIKPQQSTPLKILSIDVHGNMSAFSPELLGAKSHTYQDFVYGNVTTHSLKDMVVSPLFQKISSEIEDGVSKCKSACSYFELCGGGAPSNKFFELGSFNETETLYCQHTVQALANAVMSKLEDELKWA